MGDSNKTTKFSFRGIRKAKNEDYQKISNFLKEIFFPSRIHEKKYFDWLLSDAFVYEDIGKIKGFLGFIKHDVFFQGEKIQAFEITKWKADNGIIALQLLDAVSKSAPIKLHGSLNKNSSKVLDLKGLSIISIPRWVAFPSLKYLAPFKGRLRAMNSKKENLIKDSETVINNFTNKEVKTMSIDKFSYDSKTLLLNNKEIKAWFGRDDNWLNWRYFECPDSIYKAFRIEGVEGYCVYREIELDVKKGYFVIRLMEWNFYDTDFTLALQALLFRNKNKKIVMIEFYCTANFLGKQLEQYGFLQEEKNFGIESIPSRYPSFRVGSSFSMTIDSNEGKIKEEDYNHWYLTAGDFEFDRGMYSILKGLKKAKTNSANPPKN